MANTRPEQEQLTQILANQSDRLISKLAVDVSSVPTYQTYSRLFRLLADAYDRLAFAEKKTDPLVWEQTTVDGRNGAYLMKLLWDVRQEIRLQDEDIRLQKMQN
jgi:hypothetical protein